MGTALSDCTPRRPTRRRHPAISEITFVRRVRIRLVVGRRLPSPRKALLPQAARRSAVHTGYGPAPDCRGSADAAAAAGHLPRVARTGGTLFVAHPFFGQ